VRTPAVLVLVLLLGSPGIADGTKPIISSVTDVTPVLKDLSFTIKPLEARVEDLFRVKEVAKETSIELPADVLFDFDKADIRPDAVVALGAAAEIIRARAKGPIQIEGHTDAKGSHSHNQRLSEDRAKSVQDWLATKLGLDKAMFVRRGFGATKPIAPNANPDGSDNPAGRQLNRRVEITFTNK
jgi:outer membrane protein OmpA-like peptidoglycan-associated protein